MTRKSVQPYLPPDCAAVASRPIDRWGNIVEAIFQRRDEEFTLEFREDLATVEFLVISHLPNGTKTTDRFPDQDKAMEYFRLLEGRLTGQNWQRVDEHKTRSGKIREIFRRDSTPAPAAPAANGSAQPADGAEGAPATGTTGTYALDRPLFCPHCRERILSVHVVRLVRAQVSFTSTLPRGGRALACSACDGILSLELSGLI